MYNLDGNPYFLDGRTSDSNPYGCIVVYIVHCIYFLLGKVSYYTTS